MRRLFVFTNNYPFTLTSECFLEDEIGYLCRQFNKVIVVPMNWSETRREVPENCDVLEPLRFGRSRWKYFFYGLFNIRTLPYIISDFFASKVYRSKRRFRAWGAAVKYINNFANQPYAKKLIRGINSNDVVYFYWGIGQNVLSILLKDRAHCVSRFHGYWDLWEQSYDDYGAMRRYITKSLDFAFSISQAGTQFLKQKYPQCKVVYSPLGTRDYGLCLPSFEDGVLRVVSCSHIYPLKRIPLIFDTLNQMTTFKIEWTHIGEGDKNYMEELKIKVDNECKDHLSVVLTDTMTHSDVMDYYRSHHFDVFINLSTSEGVPVAIMEAISFGIPVVATDVGGTSDEVNSETGVLVSADPTISEVSEAIVKVTQTKYNPRKFWEANFSAENNYTRFSKILSEL